jgi:hypothetical protein
MFITKKNPEPEIPDFRYLFDRQGLFPIDSHGIVFIHTRFDQFLWG